MSPVDEEIGKIIDLCGEFAVVELQHSDACQSCHAKAVCKPLDSGKRTIQVYNRLEAHIGDSVILTESDANQLKVAAIFYGLPLLAFLLSILVLDQIIPAYWLKLPKEVWQFGLALIILVCSGLLSSYLGKQLRKKHFSVFYMKSLCQ
jgi:positive regulator of sigma E activity